MKNINIWLAALMIAVTSGLLTVGAVAKSKAPELAITLYPANGFAAENVAARSIKVAITENSGQFPDQVDPQITALARNAFIAEPITPVAIAILALGKAEPEKRKLMSESLSLSRRQLLVSAWMVADSGAREDIPGLLDHYDTMLRTSSTAASVIIPLMARTLANDNFVLPFANLLAKQPPWAYEFWRTVVRTPEAIGNAARLREMLYKPDESDDTYRDTQLISALVSDQQFETAEALYFLLVGEDKTGSLLKNGSFEAIPEYSPIDWQLFSTGEYGATVTEGKLELSAIRNSGGLFARQLVELPAKVMTIDIKPSVSIPDNAEIAVSLKCAQAMNESPQTIRIPLKQQIKNLQIDNARSGCSFFWLDIIGQASENGDGFDIALDSISLR
ncbi:hypothetical protein [Parasphingorhabdus flavimaris]|uniref:hypothetical protein n=1 Tax=Parasphingorhabdus flavimaris TaxID=266812 RepID=UPI0030035899